MITRAPGEDTTAEQHGPPELPPPPAPAYLYTERYLNFDYGPQHPLRIGRLGLTDELIHLCGLAQTSHPVRPASQEELMAFHDRRYLETLEELSRGEGGQGFGTFGLGPGDNPVFPGLFDWSSLLAGASLAAARLVGEQGHRVAFNMAGGMHHALPARASGFCYLNDPVLAIKELLKHCRRVAYIDIDAHHGDGVQWAFYDSPRVLTISLHQHPATLFPGTGYLEEMGRGEGRGFAVNIPLWPDTDDDIFVQCFETLVPPLIEAFQPDFIVTQLGADTLLTDPLANLNLTTTGFGRVLKLMRQLAQGHWVALGGGGYNVVNVARAWTLAWAVMLGREDELPRRLPRVMRERLKLGEDEQWLLDPPEKLRGRFWYRARRDAEDVIERVKAEIFPLLGVRG